MAITDFLEKVGKGAEKGLQAAGSAALPVLERTAQVVSGEAPKLDEEKRQREYAQEDALINAQAKELENQLAIGEKYGTLTPQDRQQYVDAIAGLYKHPRHAKTLMEKMRQAVYPQGATYSPGSLSTLKNAVPQGGTAAEDARLAAQKRGLHAVPGVKPFKGPDGIWYQPMYDGQGKIVNEEIEGYTPPAPKTSGRSPAISGNQLPADAVGPNGQPITGDMRIPTQSFIKFGDEWWSVPKKPPVVSSAHGHRILLDADTKMPIPGGDLGPIEGVKITDTGTWTPNMDPNNPQMVWVPKHTVTGPGGAEIEVQLSPDSESSPQGSSQSGAPPTSGQKGGVAKILKPPAAQTKTVTTPPGGVRPPAHLKTLPGGEMMAQSKTPLYKEGVTQLGQIDKDARAKNDLYNNAKGLLADDKRKTDLELVFSWVRSNVQGAGRMTNTEIQQAASVGSWGTRIQSAIAQATSGRLAPEIEQQFLTDIKRAADTAQSDADTLRKSLQTVPSGASPGAGSDVDEIVNALKGAAKKP